MNHPGPSILGAKWFRYRVWTNHPLGFLFSPIGSGEGWIFDSWVNGKEKSPVVKREGSMKLVYLPRIRVTNEPQEATL